MRPISHRSCNEDVLGAMSISKYSVLADNTKKSTPFVSKALRRPEKIIEHQLVLSTLSVSESAYIPLSIPAFVQVLLGDKFS